MVIQRIALWTLILACIDLSLIESSKIRESLSTKKSLKFLAEILPSWEKSINFFFKVFVIRLNS
jgi:hypothetical protein